MYFKYRARAADGEILEGQIEAADQRSALDALRRREMLVISLNPSGSPYSPGAGRSGTRRLSLWGRLQRIGTVPSNAKMIFFRQLATMVKAGLSLSSAMDILIGQEKNLIFQDTLLDIRGSLDRGVPLSQAMKQHSMFDDLIISLVRAGEEGGLLDDALERVAVLLEKQASLKSKIRSAMFYPAFVIFFAVCVLFIFVIFILPRFKEVFDTMHIELPGLTKAMFQWGQYCVLRWRVLVPCVLGALAVLIWLLTGKLTRPVIDRIKLKLPIIRPVVMKSAMARSTRTLSALVGAGVPILYGLEMAGDTAGNVVIRHGFDELQAAARRGVSLGDAAKQAKIFPVLVSQMMRIGEETGHLDNMLERVAIWYEQELDTQIRTLLSMTGPVLIILVGGIVGVIALSIFGPIASALSQMG